MQHFIIGTGPLVYSFMIFQTGGCPSGEFDSRPTFLLHTSSSQRTRMVPLGLTSLATLGFSSRPDRYDLACPFVFLVRAISTVCDGLSRPIFPVSSSSHVSEHHAMPGTSKKILGTDNSSMLPWKKITPILSKHPTLST